jgi:TonB family protein
VSGSAGVVAAAPAESPTFVMTLPATGWAGARSNQPTSAVEASDDPVDEAGVSTRAVVDYQPVTPYPREARAEGWEGDVPVDIVVNASGRVVSARVAGHFSYGVDDAALDTVQHTRFRPAQRQGHPVAVRMRWTMQFRLQ